MGEGTPALRRAVANELGWEWCEVHEKTRWDGADPCRHRHNSATDPQSKRFSPEGLDSRFPA